MAKPAAEEEKLHTILQRIGSAASPGSGADGNRKQLGSRSLTFCGVGHKSTPPYPDQTLKMSSIEEAFAICGYCFRPIPEEEEGLMSGAVIETTEGSQPYDFEGEAVEVWRNDDHIIAVVPDRDSEAAEDGNLIFLVCSEECAEGMDLFLSQPLPIELRPYTPK